MQTSKKLLGGEFLFIVRARDFEHQEDGIDVEHFEAVEFFVIAVAQKDKNGNNWNPNDWLNDELNNLRKHKYIIP